MAIRGRTWNWSGTAQSPRSTCQVRHASSSVPTPLACLLICEPGLSANRLLPSRTGSGHGTEGEVDEGIIAPLCL